MAKGQIPVGQITLLDLDLLDEFLWPNTELPLRHPDTLWPPDWRLRGLFRWRSRTGGTVGLFHCAKPLEKPRIKVTRAGTVHLGGFLFPPFPQ